MLIAAVLCSCAAAATAAAGLWSLAHHSDDPVRQTLRAVAPTQLAASAMLAAGGVVALVAPRHVGMLILVVCVVGAIGTVAAGCYQAAKAAARSQSAPSGCAGSCASCVLPCGSP
jgi:hypothetical protein